MERNLKLMDPVMRYLSVRQDENAPPARLRMDDAQTDDGRSDRDDDSGDYPRDLQGEDSPSSEGDA
jgi:hypothetical protein